MPAKELVQNLPEQARRWVYTAYALIGLTLGATQVAYSAAEAGQPVWLVVALAVFAFIGTALGFTAATNVGAKKAVEVDATPVPDGYEPRHAMTDPHNSTP